MRSADIVCRLSRAVGAGGKIVKRRALQTVKRNRADVADVKISVQTVLNLQRPAAGIVRNGQFHRQRVGNGHDEFRAQLFPGVRVREPAASANRQRHRSLRRQRTF